MFNFPIGYRHLDLHFGQEIDNVLCATVQLGVAFLTTEAFDLGNGYALHPNFRQCFAHVIKLEWLNNGRN